MSINLVAYEENKRNEKHMTMYENGDRFVIVVDGHKATYKGRTIFDLTNTEKRKFETLLLLTNMSRGKQPKIVFR